MKTGTLAMLSNEALADAYLGRESGMDSAFAELFRRHREMVYRVCVRWLGHHQDAEDVTQETFRRVAASIQSWDRTRPIEPWLATIAGNRCRSFLAKQRGRPRVALINESHASIADEQTTAAGVVAEQSLQEAMNALPPTSRQAFELVHLDGMSYEQASRWMGHPPGTIKTWVHRARLQVIERLREESGGVA
ncbi:RNA polymerase sigma factor [Rhodopirellula sp. JC740]|uniref:RNA polymerase sigma factor n=1 Tax=Rhodopirellula halodulae TaxID=2894198 RepID=A0ABS8NAS7_9BACT|nr:RNA polymerase sigma factor [Rhodopirellula sp. JC740]MCC9640673.1 RNA polymerase sigma factor [Rhodopirellula sp. JC740]